MNKDILKGLYRAMLYLFFGFGYVYIVKQVQSTSTAIVRENAATLFCCEVPEMFCELQNSAGMWVSRR